MKDFFILLLQTFTIHNIAYVVAGYSFFIAIATIIAQHATAGTLVLLYLAFVSYAIGIQKEHEYFGS